MKVQTASGSLYELDTTNKRVRRLIGVGDPTPRQGKDGEWKAYDAIFPEQPKIGSSLIIAWTQDVELLDETKTILAAERGFAIPTTTTSPIVAIDDEWAVQ